jgi:hypothetical protein
MGFEAKKTTGEEGFDLMPSSQVMPIRALIIFLIMCLNKSPRTGIRSVASI